MGRLSYRRSGDEDFVDVCNKSDTLPPSYDSQIAAPAKPEPEPEMVTIIAGTGEDIKEFKVAKDVLLRKAEYLCNYSARPIKIHETAETFQIFATWLETDRIEISPDSDGHFPYAFGLRTKNEAFCNDIVDQVSNNDRIRGVYCHETSLAWLYREGYGRSPLARLHLKCTAWRAMTSADYAKSYHETMIASGRMDKLLDCAELFRDLYVEIIERRRDGKLSWDPRGRGGCEFHDHRRGTKCKAVEEPEDEDFSSGGRGY